MEFKDMTGMTDEELLKDQFAESMAKLPFAMQGRIFIVTDADIKTFQKNRTEGVRGWETPANALMQLIKQRS